MSIRRWVEIGGAACVFSIVAATPARAACCDDQKQPCCETATMTCCPTAGDAAAASVLIPQVTSELRPVRETMTVWFKRPVRIADRILLGKYVIEHDNDRMARGEPCTYIYAAADRQLPVVTFHCEHLDRPRAERGSVALRSLGEPNGLQELREFQFPGEAGAHGAPGGR